MACENNLSVRQKFRVVAGLPFRTAAVYALLFAIAISAYNSLWQNAPIMEPDSGGYLQAAQDLSDFHIDQLQERAPGYSLLLLLTGSSRSPNRALFFASLLLHFLSIWLLATVLYSAGLPEIMLNMFGLILLLPPYVEPAAYVLTENLTEAMLVVGMVSFCFWTTHKKTIWIIVSGLAIGYAALTRPTYQLLPLAMAGYLLIASFLFHWTPVKWKEVLRMSLIFVGGSAVVIGGYALINYRSVGYLGLSPKLGLTLSQKTVRVIERLPDQYSAIREVLIKARNAELVNGTAHTGYSYIWSVVPELTEITGLQYRDLSDYMLRVNLLLIQKAPLEYLQDVVWAFGSYSLPSSNKLANMGSRTIQLLWGVTHFSLMGAFAVNLVLLVGAGAYIKNCKPFLEVVNKKFIRELRFIHEQGLKYGVAGTIVIYSAAITCLLEAGDPRYRVPTDALIVFMLFLGFTLWRSCVGLCRKVLCDTQRDPT